MSVYRATIIGRPTGGLIWPTLLYGVWLMAIISGFSSPCLARPRSTPPRNLQSPIDGASQEGTANFKLKPSERQEHQLVGAAVHSYQLPLEPNQYLHLRVTQKGVDVVVSVFDPAGGEPVLQSDTPNGTHGTEQLRLIAITNGTYQVEVKALEPQVASGAYEIEVIAIRPARQVERQYAAATRLMLEGHRKTALQTVADARRAAEKYEAARRLWKEVVNRQNESDALLWLGQAYLAAGEPQRALAVLECARQSWRPGDDPANKAYSLLSLGMAHFLLSAQTLELESVERAHSYLKEAEPLLQDPTAKLLHQALLAATSILFGTPADRRKTAQLLEGLLTLFGWALEPQVKAGILTVLASVSFLDDKIDKAVSHLRSAVALYRQSGAKREEAFALMLLGGILTTRSEYQSALDALRQSSRLYQELADNQGLAMSSFISAALYYHLGRPKATLESLETAEDFFRKASQASRKPAAASSPENRTGCSGQPVKSARAFSSNSPPVPNFLIPMLRGLAYLMTEEEAKGLAASERALKLCEKSECRRSASAVYIRLAVGGGYLLRGKYDLALAKAEETLRFARSLSDSLGEEMAYWLIGATYAHLADQPAPRVHNPLLRSNEKAIAYLEQIRQQLHTIGGRTAQANVLAALARYEYRRDDWGRALERIRAATTLFEQQRGYLRSLAMRATFFTEAQDAYEFHLDLLWELHQRAPHAGYQTEALQVSERLRARALLDALGAAESEIRTDADPALLKRERELQTALNRCLMPLPITLPGPAASQSPNDDGKCAASGLLIAELHETAGELRAKSPRPEPLTAAEIQQQTLDADTILLEYAFGDQRAYLFVVTRDGVTMHALPERATIARQARQVIDLITTRDRNIPPEKRPARIAQADAAYWPAAARLSQTLLGPAAERLPGKRLLIVSTGILQRLSFAALPIPTKPATPLVAEHEIVMLPSASVLAAQRQALAQRPAAPQALAVIASPLYGPAGPEPLTFAEQEVREITRFYPADDHRVWGGGRANRAAATNPALADYRIVHFAVHAAPDFKQGELSALALSPSSKLEEPSAGFLHLTEIYNLRFNSDLVVLSACRTARGEHVKGEGVVSLARGFMHAGAARVIASQWLVNDATTPALMAELYRQMAEQRQSPAAALRQAQILMWREKKLPPYYWAAFNLYGEWR